MQPENPAPLIVSPVAGQGTDAGFIVVPQVQAPKKSFKKLIIGVVIALIVVTGALLVFWIMSRDKNIGTAVNRGDGEIIFSTTDEDGEKKYYKISAENVLFSTYKKPNDYGEDSGLSYVPLACVRLIFYGKDADRNICDQESQRPELFGANFFLNLRFDIGDVIPGEDVSGLVFKNVFYVGGRTFLNVLKPSKDGAYNVLLEYINNKELVQVLELKKEFIDSLSVKGAKK